MKKGYVYIHASKPYGTIYIGVTSDLPQRLEEHENDVFPDSFTSKYDVKTLVYFEEYDRITDAIHREKRLKKYKRDWKIDLIEKTNPEWKRIHPVFGAICEKV